MKDFEAFCSYVKQKCEELQSEKTQTTALRPPPIPYSYQTPNKLDIDLRLFNKDLINNCLPILSSILDRGSRGWYVQYRLKMMQDLQGQGLSNKEMSKKINEAITEEYLDRVFEAIKSNTELDNLQEGIGTLLVDQAKTVLTMKKAVKNVQDKMTKHKTELKTHLKTKYPIKSRIQPWINEQIRAFEVVKTYSNSYSRDVKFYTNERPRTFSLSQECYNPEYLDAEEELKLRVAELMKKPLQPCAPNKVCLGYSEQSLLHKDISSGGFEECPERLQHLCKTLKNKGIWDRCLITPGRKATDDELSLAHSPDFIRQLKKIETMEEDALIKYQSSFKSVYFCQDSFKAASWSVGTLLSVVDDVLTGQSQSGVALIRPPGHHAEANTTMGFCMFNNVGIAAKYAQQKHNVNRIVIIDWDIHHGNALQTLFYDDTSVLYISLHRFDKGSFYPYGGEGYHKCVGGNSAQGYNVNIAWNDEPKGDADYVAAFQNVILPLCYEFSPDLVLVAAGFDGAKGDNLGNYRLSPELFGHMTSMLKGLAHGKLILALEGGYNLDMTSESMAYCISTLLGDPLPSLSSMIPSQSAVTSICDTIDIQSEFWKSLQYRVDLPTEKQLEIIKEQKENSMREFEEQENEDKEEDKD
ncbi:histone deacetylase 6 [Mytilus galloprovincialis]|uniref:Histone deacetylase 6 n=1 Tax=Mytilus galloprovincialis TaxID=29158 RepID=A0A8B6HMY5_MYTGA|nr:histone deacetylase 6 [Mytilus galloprovincialis]